MSARERRLYGAAGLTPRMTRDVRRCDGRDDTGCPTQSTLATWRTADGRHVCSKCAAAIYAAHATRPPSGERDDATPRTPPPPPWFESAPPRPGEPS